MASRLYLHNTTNSASGLPTTKQSSQATAGNATAVTVNKNMNQTIGTSQATLSVGSVGGYEYWSRWVSAILGQTSIAANTWTLSFGYSSGWGSSDNGVRVCIYVWRPSNSTKIGNVADVTISQAFNSSETGYLLTLTGAAVSGLNVSDVLCVEIMTSSIAAGTTLNFYYDGTTAITSNGSAASSAASYIETPENFTFLTPTTPVGCSSTAHVVTDKYITHG